MDYKVQDNKVELDNGESLAVTPQEVTALGNGMLKVAVLDGKPVLYSVEGKDQGRTRIILKDGKILELSDAELDALENDQVKLVPLAPVGSKSNTTLASHHVASKDDADNQPIPDNGMLGTVDMRSPYDEPITRAQFVVPVEDKDGNQIGEGARQEPSLENGTAEPTEVTTPTAGVEGKDTAF